MSKSEPEAKIEIKGGIAVKTTTIQRQPVK